MKKNKKGILTEKEFDKLYKLVMKYEREHPVKWYWRLVCRWPFIEKYTIIEA